MWQEKRGMTYGRIFIAGASAELRAGGVRAAVLPLTSWPPVTSASVSSSAAITAHVQEAEGKGRAHAK